MQQFEDHNNPCVFCRHKNHPILEYSIPALKLNIDMFKVCLEHKKEAIDRIATEKEEPEKVILKTGEPKRFMPPPVVAPKSFHEREPNDGSLIE